MKRSKFSGIVLFAVIFASGFLAQGLLPILGSPDDPDMVVLADELKPPAKAIMTYSVGGVLTEDGTLWQYHPDQDKWLKIDEAFKEQGRTTHVLPLPLKVEEIADMSTFGFLLSVTGEIWLYEFAGDKWRKIDTPG